MKIISIQDFEKTYGKGVLPSTSPVQQPTQPANPGYLQRVTQNVGSDIYNRSEKVGEILKRPTNIAEKGLQLFGQGAGMASNALETTVNEIPGVKQVTGGIGAGINWLATSDFSILKKLGDKIGESKTLQDVVKAYDEDPNFRDTVDAVANTARLATDVKAGVDTGTGAINTAKNVYNKFTEPTVTLNGKKYTLDELHNEEGTKLLNSLSPEQQDKFSKFDKEQSLKLNIKNAKAAGKDTSDLETMLKQSQAAAQPVKGDIPPNSFFVPEEIRTKVAIRDATPDYELSSTAERKKLLTRVKEGGTFKGREVTPSDLEIEAGKELSRIPGYDHQATKLAKYQLAKQEVARRGESLATSLSNEKIVVPKKEIVSIIKNSIEDVPNNSLLLQKSDPVIKNYLRVVQNATNKTDGTLKGVLDLRKALDDAYENARGKQAFGSDKIAALDEVHKAGRNSLTQYLIDHAKSTDVKTSLRSQWNLYRAIDELQIAAERESGSVVGRFLGEHPKVSKVITTGAKAVGLGKAVELIK